MLRIGVLKRKGRRPKAAYALPSACELGFTRVRQIRVAEVGNIRLRLGEGRRAALTPPRESRRQRHRPGARDLAPGSCANADSFGQPETRTQPRLSAHGHE